MRIKHLTLLLLAEILNRALEMPFRRISDLKHQLQVSGVGIRLGMWIVSGNFADYIRKEYVELGNISCCYYNYYYAPEILGDKLEHLLYESV